MSNLKMILNDELVVMKVDVFVTSYGIIVEFALKN
jgi:hypothetical protein